MEGKTMHDQTNTTHAAMSKEWILEGFPTKCWSEPVAGRSPGTTIGSSTQLSDMHSLDACKAFCLAYDTCKSVIWRKNKTCHALDRFYEDNYEPVSEAAWDFTGECGDNLETVLASGEADGIVCGSQGCIDIFQEGKGGGSDLHHVVTSDVSYKLNIY